MGRDMNDRDLTILKRLVPELEELHSQGVDIEYMNILPPVANHHSRGVSDFEQRLKKLSVEDMSYLADLILEGTEGLCCLQPDFAEAFFTVAGQRLSSDMADKLRLAYETSGDCGG